MILRFTLEPERKAGTSMSLTAEMMADSEESARSAGQLAANMMSEFLKGFNEIDFNDNEES